MKQKIEGGKKERVRFRCNEGWGDWQDPNATHLFIPKGVDAVETHEFKTLEEIKKYADLYARLKMEYPNL